MFLLAKVAKQRWRQQKLEAINTLPVLLRQGCF